MSNQSMTDAIVTMMRNAGITVDDVKIALDGGNDDSPTVADYVDKCLAALGSQASRRSYRT